MTRESELQSSFSKDRADLTAADRHGNSVLAVAECLLHVVAVICPKDGLGQIQ